MKLIKQQHRWQCTIVSLAMATGVPLKELVEAAGHDGKDTGYSLFEIYFLAVKFGYSLTFFDRRPQRWNGEQLVRLAVPSSTWHELMCNRVGLIAGELYSTENHGHMVAWDGECIYDPVGLKYPIRFAKDYNFYPCNFHLLQRAHYE